MYFDEQSREFSKYIYRYVYIYSSIYVCVYIYEQEKVVLVKKEALFYPLSYVADDRSLAWGSSIWTEHGKLLDMTSVTAECNKSKSEKLRKVTHSAGRDGWISPVVKAGVWRNVQPTQKIAGKFWGPFEERSCKARIT